MNDINIRTIEKTSIPLGSLWEGMKSRNIDEQKKVMNCISSKLADLLHGTLYMSFNFFSLDTQNITSVQCKLTDENLEIDFCDDWQKDFCRFVITPSCKQLTITLDERHGNVLPLVRTLRISTGKERKEIKNEYSDN